MGIARLNWGAVNDPRPEWSPATGKLYALWPSPVDHDACFEAAGFTEFADTDAAWDHDFTALVAGVFDALTELGAPSLRAGEVPVARGRRGHPLESALAAAAIDDSFSASVIGFGNPPRATLRTSDGHAILWLWTEAQFDLGALVRRVAQGRPIVNRSMAWQKLA